MEVRQILEGEFSAEETGPEDAPGIVLVHGTRMAAAYWRALLPALGERYRTVAVDLPGHGRLRATPFTHAGALAAILSAIGRCPGGRALVLGHSLGGFLAMDLAERAPQRCAGLVLVGCTAVARGPRTWPYRLALALLPLLPATRLARANDALLRHRYRPELVEPQIAAGYGFGAVAASWRAVLGQDHAAALARFPGPVLLLNGERDGFRAGERHFARACPQARLTSLPGASHLCNLDQPEAFRRVVLEFAEEVYGANAVRRGRIL